jgi:hypothetical protein
MKAEYPAVSPLSLSDLMRKTSLHGGDLKWKSEPKEGFYEKGWPGMA